MKVRVRWSLVGALLLSAGCSSATDAPLPRVPGEMPSARPGGTSSATSSAAEPPPEFDPSPFDPPLEPLPAGVVLRWSFDHALHGKEFIEVKQDGSAQVVLTDPHGSRHLASPRLSAEELAAIAKVLRESSTCSIRSRRYGIPDEVRPTMRIRLGGLACDVTLWDGEWTDDAMARRSTGWVGSARAQVHGR